MFKYDDHFDDMNLKEKMEYLRAVRNLEHKMWSLAHDDPEYEDEYDEEEEDEEDEEE